ncbi:MAG: hypothetical protein IJ086_04030 [Clostridium sp.]|nr:hypothetical protein [Clostridium sp.]
MSRKVYNRIILKGITKDIKTLIDGCYGNALILDGTPEGTFSKETTLTFNSYVKVKNIEEAIEKWGVAEDSIRYYVENPEEKLASYEKDSECEISISFETYNGIVFKWVREMAKANSKVNIKYYVTDTVTDFYSSCEFDVNTDNIEYKIETYESSAELEYKFLNHSLEELMKHKISYGECKIDTGEDDFKFNINDIMDYLRKEFKFLSDDNFKALIDKVK